METIHSLLRYPKSSIDMFKRFVRELRKGKVDNSDEHSIQGRKKIDSNIATWKYDCFKAGIVRLRCFD